MVVAGTLEQAYACLETFIPSVMLVDLSLPDGSGIDLLAYARQHLDETYLVVTTIYDDDHYLFSALKAGGSGYLLKDQPRHTLMEALPGIMAGKPPLTPAIARRILRHFQQVENKTADNPLSEREKEVMVLLSKGMGRSDIAELLDVSAQTAAGRAFMIQSAGGGLHNMATRSRELGGDFSFTISGRKAVARAVLPAINE